MLEPKNIRDVWQNIKPKLEEMSFRYRFDWIPEDVYHSCVSGECSLWVADEGFIVIKSSQNQFTDQTELFIWITYGDGLVHDKYLPQMEQIARSIGAKKIKMDSPRPGFIKKGWSVEKITYTREVSHGK